MKALRWPDVLLPAVIVVLGVVELIVARYDGWPAGIALELLCGALLVFRRFHTLVVAPLSLAVLLVMSWVGPQLDQPATPILLMAVACYALARWLDDLRGLFGIAAIAAILLVDYLFADDRLHNLSDAVFVSTLLGPPYVVGRIVRRLAAQAEKLRAAQTVIAAQAVRDERDRIARELHDVIAHSVSAMVVQTAAAQDLIRTDPDRAEEVLADVAATGRQALSETGRLLHVIRDTDDELGLAPVPGLADVPALVERFRADGLDVDLALELPDPAPQLPSGVDISAYRIVQEALTNALRYAPDRAADLRLSATPERVAIVASNSSAGRTGSGSGLGLLGIAERVSVLGGTLTHGTGPDGRFRLDATLPVTT
jgi:signal transduction histidine kinase